MLLFIFVCAAVVSFVAFVSLMSLLLISPLDVWEGCVRDCGISWVCLLIIFRKSNNEMQKQTAALYHRENTSASFWTTDSIEL